VLCNTGPYTVTLPAAASNSGKVYYIKNISSTNVTITLDGNASETIDGSTTFDLRLYKHAVRIICDGSHWHVLENTGTEVVSNTFHPINCDGSGMVIKDVLNPTTGKIWMDRNLGASRVATTNTDASGIGDLYQWGRLKDGHQCRNSSTTATQSSGDVPGNANFITNGAWRSTTNDNLWQGASGINNPCPSGYRVPTHPEWTAEQATWSSGNSTGAYASSLKLPVGGFRVAGSGSITTDFCYWTSTVSGSSARYIWGDGTSYVDARGHGASVRCIKN
jgi:hypothetical protein